jgi:hypothetical protein
MSTSKGIIDQFMDENCVVEFKICKREELDEMEQDEIKRNYLPLNYQHTKGILSVKYRRIFSQSKKNMRY